MASTEETLTEIEQMVSAEAVVIYSKTWCPYCTQCKELLDSMGQPYAVVELDRRDDGEAVQAALLTLTQQRTVPSVFVAGMHLGGNDDTQAAARSGRLAEMLARSSPAPAAGSSAGSPSTSSASDAPAGFDPLALVFSTLFPSGKGSKIMWGVFQQSVDEATLPSLEDRALRREVAAAQLVNIDGDERDRRKQAGLAFLAVSTALAGVLLVTDAGAGARFAVAPPLFLAVGFLASWREGL